MSYAAIAALVAGKRPIWLYRITLGSEEVRYTSRSTGFDQTDHDMFDTLDMFDGADFFTRTWERRPINHTRFRQTGATARAETTIILPGTDPFARLFLDDGGVRESTVTIWHGYTNDVDAEFVVKFRGRVIDTRPFLGRITLACENRFTSMRRKGLSAVMQRPCRHALYHTGCNLNIADFEVDATATAFAVPVLTVAAAALQADGYYSGGVVTFKGRRQMVIAHTGTSLALLAPISGLAQAIADGGSAPVQIAPGCNLSMRTCQDKFNNLLNHGGFPRMTDSPFDGRNPF